MLEVLGLAQELPVLKRPIGGLLTAEGRQCAVATYVLHGDLPRVHRGLWPRFASGRWRLRKTFFARAPHLILSQFTRNTRRGFSSNWAHGTREWHGASARVAPLTPPCAPE